MTVIAMTREIGSHGMAAAVAARLGPSTYRLLAAYQTLARLNAGVAEATRRFSECRRLISTNESSAERMPVQRLATPARQRVRCALYGPDSPRRSS
jgi:hypothetical protein